MRRRSVLLSAVVLVAAPPVLAACGGDELPVKVSGTYGKEPEVTIPRGGKPGGKLVISTLVEGKGPRLRKGELVVADYVGYRWNGAGSKRVITSYGVGRPGAFPSGKLVPGLDKALAGQRVGSRVVAVIPPAEGFGDRGDSRHQIAAGDSLVYVLDLRASYAGTAAVPGSPQPPADPRLPRVGTAAPGQAPPVTIPKAAPPKKLQVRSLTQGTGPAVKGGELVALQFTGVLWRGGTAFYSTWRDEGRPVAEVLGVGQDIKAFDEGLVGQKVGSRMLLVVPPAWGYGTKGLPRYGIKGTDTLVYVVDILGAY